MDFKVVSRDEDNLSCYSHKKADLKIVYNVCKIAFDACVMITYSDKEILIIKIPVCSGILKDTLT